MSIEVPAARFAYVGTYTAPGVAPGGDAVSTAEGIYVFRIDPRTGALALLQVAHTSNPSYLAIDRERARLYCANEDDAGRVSAFAIDPASGELRSLGSAPAGGSLTTHLSLHPSRHYLLAANYGTGDYGVVRVLADGSLGALTGRFRGEGRSAHPERQAGPHAHQIVSDPSGAHVFGVDLGADVIHVLQLELDAGTLSVDAVPAQPIAAGSGPRHLTFHPSLPRAYLLNELEGSIVVFDYDATRGALSRKQKISTLPARFERENLAGEIRIHPSGRFLYTTNRGHDSIALFAIDPETGTLESLGWEPTRGAWPRGLNIDPSGERLYALNQNSGTIAVFDVDRGSGALKHTAMVETPTPVDLAFG